eukprot:s2530_g4.t1
MLELSAARSIGLRTKKPQVFPLPTARSAAHLFGLQRSCPGSVTVVARFLALMAGWSEVKELGSGKLILPIEEAGAEAAIAAPDFMNAARCVVLVATGAASAPTVAKGLGEASPSCPASLLRPKRLTWLLDAESAASV